MKIFFKVAGIIVIKIFITAFIFLGINHTLDFSDSVGEYIWELMIFSFLVGTFIVSIRADHLGGQKIKILSKVGFLIVISSIIVLIGHGFGFINSQGLLTSEVIRNSSGTIAFAGLFLFCYCLLELIWGLSKSIFSKQ